MSQNTKLIHWKDTMKSKASFQKKNLMEKQFSNNYKLLLKCVCTQVKIIIRVKITKKAKATSAYNKIKS